MNALLRDVVYGVRTLLKSPGFAAVAIVTMALGIGANTALFSVVNGVLLSPLPYPNPDELVALYGRAPGYERSPIAYPNFLDWQRNTRSFASIALYHNQDYNFTGAGEAERVSGYMIAANFFDVLGVAPIRGRAFNADDDRVGAAPVVILGGGFCERRFGCTPDVVGTSIDLNGVSYAIVGVVPATFSFYGRSRDVYAPIGQWNDPTFHDRRVVFSSGMIGRLKPGVTLAQARADMDNVARNLAATYPEADKGSGATLVSMKEDMVGDVQPVLLVLLGAVTFLLLIACANIASLLLARCMARSAEFAIRASLGASRRQIVRQVLTESLVLAGIGGALGLAFALWGTKAALGVLPSALPRANDISVDARVLFFTAAMSVVGGILFGITPAFNASRVDLHEVLKAGGRGSAGRRHWLEELLVFVAIAMALVLLVGAGLMTRSLTALWHVDPGFNPSHALTFSLSLPASPANRTADTRAGLRAFDAAMQSVPGVEAVSVTLGSRPMQHTSSEAFWVEGRPKPANINEMNQAMFYLAEAVSLANIAPRQFH
jgi:putative ABC transport system permease protein